MKRKQNMAISLSRIQINKPQGLSCIDDSSKNSLLLFLIKVFITLQPLFFTTDNSKYSLWSTLLRPSQMHQEGETPLDFAETKICTGGSGKLHLNKIY